ncbi:hypothetical protein COE51_21975 [Bacillus pseudomycoides]|nr:hypothetical protein COE51_21975 [Bacillus pseudomycoides]
MKVSLLLKYWMISIGILAIFCGCSTTDEWEGEVSESSLVSGNSFLTSPSPNQVHIIDLQEVSTGVIDEKDKKISWGNTSFRIYYGDYGNKLENYKDFEGFDLMTVDNFEVKWQDDNVVLIDVYRKAEDGTRFKDETIRLDTSL